jgi:multidrug efflux pump subunit AcrA (membrane-fusion protein)
MFVRVLIASGKGRVVTAPLEALQEDGGEPVVFVEEATGMYRRRPVRPGATLGDTVVVESGLKSGERVVTQGSYQLLAQSKRG